MLRKLVGQQLYLVSFGSGDCDDASNALGNAALLEDDEILDLTCVLDMCTATELDTDVAPFRVAGVLEQLVYGYTYTYDSHRIRVRLTKDGANTLDLTCSGERYVLCIHDAVLADVGSALVLDRSQLLVGQTGLVAKIETQLLFSNERTPLVDVIAKDFAEGKVKDMCASVVVAQWASSALVVRTENIVARTESALQHNTCVKDVAGVDLDVVHVKQTNSVNHNLASVVFLSALLGIKVGLVEKNTNLLPFWNILGALQELLVVVDGLDRSMYVVTAKFRTVICLWHSFHLVELAQIVYVQLWVVCRGLLLALASFLRGFLRFGDFLLADVETTFLGHQLSQIDGEAISVVQPPHIGTGKLL